MSDDSTPISPLQQAKIKQFESAKERAHATIEALPIESHDRLYKITNEMERWLKDPNRKRFDNGSPRKDAANRAFSELVRKGPHKKQPYSDVITALRPKGVLPREDDAAMKRLKGLVSRNPRVYYEYDDGEVGAISRINES